MRYLWRSSWGWRRKNLWRNRDRQRGNNN